MLKPLQILTLATIIFNLAAADVYCQLIAFPGAEGYGRFATGGRGGKIIEVTNLNDNGKGSFRYAVTRKEPRIVIFKVAGIIKLKSELRIKYGNLTIAGQSAPGDGICITGNRTYITADNIIIRFLRFRLGDEMKVADDALCAMNGKNIIIDHCSLSWGIDEVGTFYDNENFTLQWSVLYEALDSSVHPKGTHGYGGIWGGVNASFHHNLLAHNSSRNPRFNGARYQTGIDEELVDFRNNVIYNWGINSSYGGEKGRQNIIANYYKHGPASHKKNRIVEPFDDEGRWFVDSNYVEGYPGITSNNWAGGVQGDYANEPEIRSTEVFGTYNIKTQIPADAFADVLAFAGAMLPVRDVADTRVLAEVKSGTTKKGNGIINSQSEVGGFPEYKNGAVKADSDNDGMPDEWEIAHGLNFKDPSDAVKTAASGYTNIEEYLNELAADTFPKYLFE